MHYRFLNSIPLKVLTIEFVVLTITFGLATHFEYQRTVDVEKNAFESRVTESLSSLARSLTLPVWNFSSEEINEILSSATSSPHVESIRIRDVEGALIAQMDSSRSFARELQTHAAFDLQRSLKLKHKDRELGTLEMVLDDSGVQASIADSLRNSILRNLASLGLILLATFIFLQRSILSKIAVLSRQSELMKAQILDQSFAWQAGDELNSLGEALEGSRKSLRDLIESQARKNQQLNELTQNLEKLVAEKSAQVVHQSRLASLGELSAGMAHEINNPLGIISTSAQVLRKQNPNDARFTSRLDAIDRAVQRIEKIISGLRKFSRSSGTLQMKPEALSNLIQEVLPLVEAKSKRERVPLELDLQSSEEILCDSIEIEQVLINLINNGIDAVKASPGERWVRIQTQNADERIILRVMDSGPGIPKEARDRLFQPFFTTKPVGEGTGLGLSIVKGIVESHKATLRLNPDMKNTCFEIEFPKLHTGNKAGLHEAA